MQGEANRAANGGLLSRPEDVHCVVYHVITLLAYATAFWLWLHPEMAGLHGLPERFAFVLTAAPLLGWISGIDVGVNFHNHTHRRIFRSHFLSRWFGRLWTPCGGWPAHYWQYLHVTVHHSNLLEARDWTVPRRLADGRFESSLSYQLRQWPWRTVRHFAADIRAGRLDGRRAAKELGWFLLFWSIPFWIDPVMALCLWVLPQWCANVITLGRGMYVQHAGCEPYPADPTHRHSNDFLSSFYNRTMFHIGYHSEHHDHPGVHWWDLPALHESLQKQGPALRPAPHLPAATARTHSA